MRHHKNENGTVYITELVESRPLSKFTMAEVHSLVHSGEWDLDIFIDWAMYLKSHKSPTIARADWVRVQGQWVHVSLSGKPNSWERRKFSHISHEGYYVCFGVTDPYQEYNWYHCKDAE